MSENDTVRWTNRFQICIQLLCRRVCFLIHKRYFEINRCFLRASILLCRYQFPVRYLYLLGICRFCSNCRVCRNIRQRLSCNLNIVKPYRTFIIRVLSNQLYCKLIHFRSCGSKRIKRNFNRYFFHITGYHFRTGKICIHIRIQTFPI